MVSTVSTRGVKFKFSEGEKVLCYEPDPTKAKVLYDSKVLELNVSRDNRGRKVPEYLIHFFGWSSSWDRCVKEEFILPDTEENRVLQTKLAQEAASCLKGKRKSKLPPIIKETLLKKENPEEPKEPEAMVKKEPPEPSASESSDDESERVVEIDIPDPLKEKLADDAFYVTKKNKVIRLPCEYNVVSILEDYVKHVAVGLLSPQGNKSAKLMKEISVSTIEARVHYCKEVMDGVRVYFDFTLPHLLLYRQEKKQFYTLESTCMPAQRIKEEVVNNSDSSCATGTAVSGEQNKSAHNASATNQSPPSQTPTRAGLRNHSASQKSPTTTQKSEDSGNTPRHKSGRVHKERDTAPVHKKLRAVGSREGLRSRGKNKSSEEPHGTPKQSANATSSVSPEADKSSEANAHPDSPTSPTSPTRQTRRSTQNATIAAQSVSSPHVTKSPPVSHKKATTIAPVSSSPPAASAANLVTPLSVCVTSTASPVAPATSATIASPKQERGSTQPHSPHLPVGVLQMSASPQLAPSASLQPVLTHAGLLKELLEWRMLPQSYYEQKPAAPSLIYGVHHLLRLFVKLPELIYKSSISQKKLPPLLDTLEDFLRYITERKDELFLPNSYIDPSEDAVISASNTSTRAV